jgi:hypothetical protein
VPETRAGRAGMGLACGAARSGVVERNFQLSGYRDRYSAPVLIWVNVIIRPSYCDQFKARMSHGRCAVLIARIMPSAIDVAGPFGLVLPSGPIFSLPHGPGDTGLDQRGDLPWLPHLGA